VIVACCVTCSICRDDKGEGSRLGTGLLASLPWLLSLTFLVFPMVSSAAFRAFSCEDFGDHSFLRADYAVECGTDAHARAESLAWLGIGLYPIGISLLYIVLMWNARHALSSDKPTALSKALGFLVRDYEPAYFWWELLEAWKKLFLVGFAVLIEPGSVVQLVVAFLFSLVYMLLTAVAQPFKDDSDDYFAKACGFGLTAVFFFSVILKVGVLSEAVDDVLSEQLRSRFSFNAAIVAVGMIASIVGALALSLIMAVRQLLAASRLPIMKLKETKALPELSLAVGGVWHLFLSHIWGSGQDQCATIKRQLCLLMPGVSIFLDVDDLKDIAALETYVDQTAVIMIFVSRGYFKSGNCLREARCTVEKKKPITLVHDSAVYLKSYMPLEEIKANECPPELLGPVFDGREVIPWQRIKEFQQVSLKLLAEQVLRGCPAPPEDTRIYIQGELPLQKKTLAAQVRLYVSPNNPGAAAVADDLRKGMANAFELTSNAASATHFLLYLNDQTYLDEPGEKLAAELKLFSGKTKRVMVHENDGARGGCDFSIFFDGRTPQDLMQSGIYNDLALALYSGAFFPVSVALVADALGAVGRGGRGAFHTARAARSPASAPAGGQQSGQPPMPHQKTLPGPNLLLTGSDLRGEAGAMASSGHENNANQPPDGQLKQKSKTRTKQKMKQGDVPDAGVGEASRGHMGGLGPLEA